MLRRIAERGGGLGFERPLAGAAVGARIDQRVNDVQFDLDLAEQRKQAQGFGVDEECVELRGVRDWGGFELLGGLVDAVGGGLDALGGVL